jgi:hypothetical protein
MAKQSMAGELLNKAAGAAAGPLGEFAASYLTSNLIKPNKNPFYAQQQADYNQKRRLNKYYDKYLSDQQDMYNKYNPVYQKTTDMAIEAANKPLTSTDMFKGLGPTNDIMNTQNQQSQAGAQRVANNNGLYGGARAGLQNSVQNSNNAAIAKSVSDFQGNYEANAPARMAGAQAMAAGAYGNASQGMMSGMGALNAQYSDLIGTGQALGQQQLDSQNDAQNRQAALMAMLGDMFENKNNQQMFNKQFKQNQNQHDAMMRQFQQSGGYNPQMGLNLSPNFGRPNVTTGMYPRRNFFSTDPNAFNLGGRS